MVLNVGRKRDLTIKITLWFAPIFKKNCSRSTAVSSQNHD